MNMLQSIVESVTVQNLGWMLIHSVWQLALLGGVYRVMQLMLRDHAANVRYVVGVVTMLLMLLTLPLTLLFVHPNDAEGGRGGVAVQTNYVGANEGGNVVGVAVGERSATPPAAASTGPVTVGGDAVSGEMVSDGEVSENAGVTIAERLVRGIAPVLPYVTMMWMMGIVVLAARQCLAFKTMKQYVQRGTRAAELGVVARARAIAGQMNLTRSFEVLVSSRIDVPSVIGHFKPVILLPVGMMSNLSPSQVETILAHELAHIKRYDYLVNLVQSAIETMLFYHPAVRWVSKEIRREREHCCDDVTLGLGHDAVTYARTLTMLEVGRGGMSEARLAATDGPLLGRIRRILEGPGVKGQPRDKYLVTTTVLTLVIVATALVFATPKMTEATVDDAKAKIVLTLEANKGKGHQVNLNVKAENKTDEVMYLSAFGQHQWIEYDGKWYGATFDTTAIIKTIELKPGQVVPRVGYLNINTGSNGWRGGFEIEEKDFPPSADLLNGGKGKPLKLTPGAHQFRVAIPSAKKVSASRPEIGGYFFSNRITVNVAAAPEELAGLPDNIKVSGTVVDDETNEPVTRFTIQAGKFDHGKPGEVTWGYSESTSSNKTGKYRANLRWKQGWTARVLADGYLPRPILEPTVKPDGETMEIVVRMKRGPKVEGVVLDHENKPVKGAAVFAVAEKALNLHSGAAWQWDERNEHAKAVHTNAKGEFTLHAGTADRVAVSCDEIDVWPASIAKDGKTIVKLPKPATFKLKYQIPGGDDEVTVSYQLLGHAMEGFKKLESIRSVKLKQGEAVALDSLAPGKYQIWRTVKRTGKGAQYLGQGSVFLDREFFEVTAGEVKAFDFVRTKGARLKGRIVIPDETELVRLVVNIEAAEKTKDPIDKREWTKVYATHYGDEKTGVYTTEQVPPGEYYLVVEAYVHVKRSNTFRTGRIQPSFTAKMKFKVDAGGVMTMPDLELKARE